MKKSFLICYMIFLEKSYNPLLRSIFSSLEIYAQPIYFLNYEANIQYIQLEKKFKNIDWVVESFITKDKIEIDYRFHLMFEISHSRY